MKNLIILTTAVSLVLSLGECNKTESVTISNAYAVSKTVTLPKGTITNYNQRSQTYHFRLPEAYAIVAENSDGSLSNLFTEGDLTCTCISPSNAGCSPFIANSPKGEIIGCSMNNCNTCMGKISNAKGESFDINKVNIIEKDNPIQFVLTLEEYRELQEPNAKIFDSKSSISRIQEFIAGFQSEHLTELREMTDIDHLKDIGYILAPVNFYGYRIYLPVDKSLKLNSTNPVINDLVALYNEGGGKYGCRCETNERGCRLKTKSLPLIGCATWCESGSCGSCTLVMD